MLAVIVADNDPKNETSRHSCSVIAVALLLWLMVMQLRWVASCCFSSETLQAALKSTCVLGLECQMDGLQAEVMQLIVKPMQPAVVYRYPL